MAINLQSISIILEAMIVIVCLFTAIHKKRFFAYGFALTFLIYVFYDSAIFYGWIISKNVLSPLFFLATISALLGAILMYEENGTNVKSRKK
jgi:hypothetical protein